MKATPKFQMMEAYEWAVGGWGGWVGEQEGGQANEWM